MHKKGYEWDFSEMLIELPGRDSIQRIEGILNNEIGKLNLNVRVGKEKISESETVCNVFILGLHTHKIRLIGKEKEKIISQKLPRIAIIIDDIGYDRELALLFMDLGLPMSFSVLPMAPHTLDIANEAGKRGCELLLHLPMEPRNYPELDPGPGSLLTTMGEDEIIKLVNGHIGRVPGIKGVNNHMGSYFTERYDKMKIVLKEVKRHHLFYVDSRTTRRTVAFDLAKEMGIPGAKKNVFIDNELSLKSLRYQMERMMGIARYSGSAVGIGHPHRETLKILREYMGQLKNDFEVVPVSELVS